MFHGKRTWSVGPVESAEQLAEKLTQHTWTLCTAFELAGYLFLNDSTSEDGAQEFAVVKRMPGGTLRQVESITFGWCSETQALDYIRRSIAGEFDRADYAKTVSPRLETPEEHGRCGHCA
jgi:hypothetical protein